MKAAPHWPARNPAQTCPSRLVSTVLGNSQAIVLVLLTAVAVVSLLYAGLSVKPRPARAEVAGGARRLGAGAREGKGTPLLSVDPAMEIINRIVSRRFEDRREVVTERLLDRFDEVAGFLEQVDERQARCLYRGAGWSQIEAPVNASEGEEGAVQKVRLRFLKEDRAWRLDQSRLLSMEPRHEG